MTNCPLCSGKIARDTKMIEYKYKDHTREIEQSGDYCEVCGEGFLSPADLRQSKKELADFKREVDDLLTGKDLARIRKNNHLSQKEASELFGGGVRAFHKYEVGENTQSKPLDILLRLIDSNKITIEDIRRLYAPHEDQNSDVGLSVG